MLTTSSSYRGMNFILMTFQFGYEMLRMVARNSKHWSLRDADLGVVKFSTQTHADIRTVLASNENFSTLKATICAVKATATCRRWC